MCNRISFTYRLCLNNEQRSNLDAISNVLTILKSLTLRMLQIFISVSAFWKAPLMKLILYGNQSKFSFRMDWEIYLFSSINIAVFNHSISILALYKLYSHFIKIILHNKKIYIYEIKNKIICNCIFATIN